MGTTPRTAVTSARLSRAGLPAAAGVVAALVSGIGIATPTPWRDEAVTLSMATRSLDDLLVTVLNTSDAVHGVYYLLMHAWLQVAPDSVLSLRLLSAAAVGAGVAAVVELARRIGGITTGVVAGALLLALPRTLWLATEARSFALVLALAAWSLVAAHRALGSGRWRDWALWGALSLALSWLFVVALVVPVVQAVTAAVGRRGRAAKQPLVVLAAIVGLSAPLLLVAFAQRGQISWVGEMARNPLHQFLTTQWFGDGAVLPVVVAATFVAAVVGLLVRHRATSERADRTDPAVVALLLVSALALPAVALMSELGPVPLAVPRYTVASLPAFAVVLAVGLRAFPWPAAPAVAVLVGVLAVPDAIEQRAVEAKSRWAEIEVAILAVAAPGDALVFDQGERGDTPRGLLIVGDERLRDFGDPGLVQNAADASRLTDVLLPWDEAIQLADPGQAVVVVHATGLGSEAGAGDPSGWGFTRVGEQRVGGTMIERWIRVDDAEESSQTGV